MKMITAFLLIIIYVISAPAQITIDQKKEVDIDIENQQLIDYFDRRLGKLQSFQGEDLICIINEKKFKKIKKAKIINGYIDTENKKIDMIQYDLHKNRKTYLSKAGSKSALKIKRQK